MRAPLRLVRGRACVLPCDDLDTDQIVPARFLTGTRRTGLAAALFADRRRAADGSAHPDFPLDAPELRGARLLVAGRNFGCGSSREHAVWALREHGFEAVLALSLGDIFRRNALKNGLLAAVVEPAFYARLRERPELEVAVDVHARRANLADGTACSFALEPFARHCLLEGLDELDFLLAQRPAIEAFEQRRAARGE